MLCPMIQQLQQIQHITIVPLTLGVVLLISKNKEITVPKNQQVKNIYNGLKYFASKKRILTSVYHFLNVQDDMRLVPKLVQKVLRLVLRLK